MKTIEIDKTEMTQDIYESYINGNFTQARFQIADALEAGIDILEEIEEITSEYGHKNFRKFIAVAACQYLANTPTLEARQNVLKW